MIEQVGEMHPSEAQLRIVIDTIPALAGCYFTDGTAEFMNRRWLEYTGLSHEEATGWGLLVTLMLTSRLRAWRRITKP
jgi:PAS domain-containing protein